MMATSGFSCSLCGARFRRERHGEIEIDRCETCGAVWFDRQELAAYAESKRARKVGKGRPVRSPGEYSKNLASCPRCTVRETLEPFEWKDYRFHRCRQCHGVQVGAIELERMIGDLRAEAIAHEPRERAIAIILSILFPF